MIHKRAPGDQRCWTQVPPVVSASDCYRLGVQLGLATASATEQPREVPDIA